MNGGDLPVFRVVLKGISHRHCRGLFRHRTTISATRMIQRVCARAPSRLLPAYCTNSSRYSVREWETSHMLKPERDMDWLHGLIDRCEEMFLQVCQLHLTAQGRAEGGQRPFRVVPDAVEAPVDKGLDAKAWILWRNGWKSAATSSVEATISSGGCCSKRPVNPPTTVCAPMTATA